MSKPQKILIALLWCLALVVMAAVVCLQVWNHRRQQTAAAENLPPEAQMHLGPVSGNAGPAGSNSVIARNSADGTGLPILFHVPDFSLTDQHGNPATAAELRGHVWVVDFIFTDCAGSCPVLSSKMEGLEKTIKDPSVRFVSFTVDPKHDNPKKLSGYADNYHADHRWIFLTGEPVPELATVRQMKITVLPATANDPIMHDEHFFVVDRNGDVRGVYQSLRPDEIERLARDVATLQALPGGAAASASAGERP